MTAVPPVTLTGTTSTVAHRFLDIQRRITLLLNASRSSVLRYVRRDHKDYQGRADSPRVLIRPICDGLDVHTTRTLRHCWGVRRDHKDYQGRADSPRVLILPICDGLDVHTTRTLRHCWGVLT